jgi:hypothetical protein
VNPNAILGDWYGSAIKTVSRADPASASAAISANAPNWDCADPERWQQGYVKGLALYCQPERHTPKAAPERLTRGLSHDHLFRADYDRGYAEYRQEQQVEENRQLLMALYDEQQRLWEQLVNSQNPGQRRKLRDQLAQLERAALAARAATVATTTQKPRRPPIELSHNCHRCFIDCGTNMRCQNHEDARFSLFSSLLLLLLPSCWRRTLARRTNNASSNSLSASSIHGAQPIDQSTVPSAR